MNTDQLRDLVDVSERLIKTMREAYTEVKKVYEKHIMGDPVIRIKTRECLRNIESEGHKLQMEIDEMRQQIEDGKREDND